MVPSGSEAGGSETGQNEKVLKCELSDNKEDFQVHHLLIEEEAEHPFSITVGLLDSISSMGSMLQIGVLMASYTDLR